MRNVVGGSCLPALIVVVAGALACRHEPPPPEPSSAAEAPVPAPDGLLAEGTFSTPNASWGKVQRGVGGYVGILPSTLGGLVTTATGLDPTLGPEIDGNAPAYVAVADAGGHAAWAIAVKLVDARRARGGLVDGDAARYTARDAAGLTELVPKAGR